MTIEMTIRPNRRKFPHFASFKVLTFMCIALLALNACASQIPHTDALDQSFDDSKGSESGARRSKINEDSNSKSILAQTILLSQKLHGLAHGHEDAGQDDFNITYYTDILNEAATYYIKLKQAKKTEEDNQKQQPIDIHPYDSLIENRTLYEEMSDAAKERQLRLIHSRPIVAIFTAEFLAYYHAAADGFNVEEEAADIERCIWYAGLNALDIADTWNFMTNGTFRYDEYLEFTLALGNFSSIFQMCYETVDGQIYDFWLYIQEFETIVNYLLHLIPNLLSYAFLLSQWIRTIKDLNAIDDKVNLVYVYCVIIRKLLFYEYRPEDWENQQVEFDEDGNVIQEPVSSVNRQSNQRESRQDRRSNQRPKPKPKTSQAQIVQERRSLRPELASLEGSNDEIFNQDAAKFSESLKFYGMLFTQATADLLSSLQKPSERIVDYFMTIDGDEDPELGVNNIETVGGKLAYQTIHHISKRLGHEVVIDVPQPERSDFDTDIKYPMNASRDFLGYMSFAYNFMYEFLNFALNMDIHTYVNACDQSIQDWAYYVDQCRQIYSDIYKWGRQPHFISNFKSASFVHVTFLELIYPTSAYCFKIDNEIKNYFTEINFVFREGQKRKMMVLNGFMHAGDILLELISLDRCFEGWGGSCPGRVLGQALRSLLDPTAADVYAELNNHSLHGPHGSS